MIYIGNAIIERLLHIFIFQYLVFLFADGYAPFSSMTARETFLNIPDTVIAAPGPGQYDAAEGQLRITGGHTLANKAKRFEEDASTSVLTPGPGTYTLSKSSDWFKKTGLKEKDIQQGQVHCV